MLQITLMVALALQAAAAPNPDPAYRSLQHAYNALRDKKYDQAVAAFRQSIELAPNRPSIRKDMAYTLLKIGENEAARDQFREAMRLDPTDQHVALEYAFLCYETKQQAEARRIFDRIRKTGDTTAEQAFQNIDQPLATAIARWQKALEMSPDNFSAHQELATLGEQRDDYDVEVLVDELVRSESVHRVQEVQAALAFDVWVAVQGRLSAAATVTCSRRSVVAP